MRNINSLKIIAISLVAVLFIGASGCGIRRPPAENGKPIEPLAPGADNAQLQTLEGHFSVKSSDVQIQDLSVTDNGELTVVGTAAKSIYLLERGGKLRWEMTLNSEPLRTLIDPTGTLIYVGTAGGKLLFLDTNQTERAKVQFDAPVSLLSLSEDGSLILAGIQSDDKKQPDKVAVFDKAGNLQWEIAVDTLLEAKIAGPDNQIYLNWIDAEVPLFARFSATGEKLWQAEERVLFAVDNRVQTLVSTNGEQIFGYNSQTDQQWQYQGNGAVKRFLLADSGSHLGVLTVEESTRNEDLIYLSAGGREIWRKRLPTDSDVLVSPDGRRVLVASWRQYRDDATQIFVYNEKGEEMNALEVAGRTRKMALAGQANILVLGLEDGTVYFLNIADSVLSAASDDDRTLYSYYSPVDFGREEGESRLTLFFFDENAQALVPVTRRVKRTQSLLRASIEELVRGPIQGSSLHRTIPKEAEINVDSRDGVVQVDLPLFLHEMAGTTFLTGVIDSLLMTVSQFPNLEKVQFTIAGEPSETFGQEGLYIGEAFLPRRFGRNEGERLIYLPNRSGDKYYLFAQTQPFVSLKDKALIETMVRYVLEQSQQLFGQEIELREVRIENNKVQLDFSESFNRIIADNAEAAARAAMLRDALALTIAENVYYSNLEILVNGKPPRAAEHYLPWEISVTKPYYVNLEQ